MRKGKWATKLSLASLGKDFGFLVSKMGLWKGSFPSLLLSFLHVIL